MQKNKVRFFGFGVVLAVLGLVGFTNTAHAAAPFLPSGLLGQASFTDNTITPITAQNLENPTDTVIDTVHHRLFVSDGGRSRILVYTLDADNNLIDNTPDAVLGRSDFVTGDPPSTPPPTASNLACGYYCGLAYDSDRNLLFVSDRYHFRVLVFDVSTIVDGEDAVNVIGQPDFTTSSCQTTQNGMCSIESGLAYDAEHKRLFVPDAVLERVLVFDVSTISNHMNASYVIGQPDFTTSNSPSSPTDSNINIEWSGIVFDPATQRLFVSGGTTHRVLVFDVTPGTMTNNKAASYVIGQPDFTSSTSGGAINEVGLAQGMVLDPVHKQLFLADYDNCRVTVYDTESLSNGPSAVAALGVSAYGIPCGSGPSVGTMIPDAINMAIDTTHHRLYLPDGGYNRILLFDLARITSDALPSGTIEKTYSGSVATTGTQGDTHFSILTGTLPPGLSLNTTTGGLVGTPTTAGTYHFTVKLVDDNGPVGSFWDSREQVVTITPSDGGNSSSSSSTSSGSLSLPSSASTSSGEQPTPDISSESGQMSEETPFSTDVFLNEREGYFGDGTSLTLSQNQSISFCIGDVVTCDKANRYTITLASIDEDAHSVMLHVAPKEKEVTLLLRRPSNIDANDDHADDIRATLTAVNKSNASITFQNIKRIALSNNKLSPKDNEQGVNWLPWMIGTVAVILVVGIVYLLVRNR